MGLIWPDHCIAYSLLAAVAAVPAFRRDPSKGGCLVPSKAIERRQLRARPRDGLETKLPRI